jgi:hypothetical protein
VVATVTPTGLINVIVGRTQAVTVTFTTSDGRRAKDLLITGGMSPLPAGWTRWGSDRTVFLCSTITAGNTCQMTLNYTPTVATVGGTLTLDYRYTDNAHTVKTATTNITYSSRSTR